MIDLDEYDRIAAGRVKIVAACPYEDDTLATCWKRGFEGQNNMKTLPGSAAERAWYEGRLAGTAVFPSLAELIEEVRQLRAKA